MEPSLATQVPAVCPAHPEQAAAAACSRCGTFICKSCVASAEPPLCAVCFARRGLPLLGEPFSFGGALGGSLKLFGPTLVPILGVCAIYAVPLGLLELFLDENFQSSLIRTYVGMLATSTIGLLGTNACLALMTARAERHSATFGWALAEGFRAWPRVFGARFKAGLTIVLYLLLLIVPGIVVATRLCLVTPAAYLGSIEASRESKQLVYGHGWTVFGLVAVSNLVVVVAVGVFSGVLDMLRTAAPMTAIGVAVCSKWVALVCVTWLTSMLLAAYYGLRHSGAEA